jgi:hypothetical protein
MLLVNAFTCSSSKLCTVAICIVPIRTLPSISNKPPQPYIKPIVQSLQTSRINEACLLQQQWFRHRNPPALLAFLNNQADEKTDIMRNTPKNKKKHLVKVFNIHT